MLILQNFINVIFWECTRSCLRFLAGDRATEVSFGRFLGNRKVTVTEIESSLAQRTEKACQEGDPVLLIQDTVECGYPRQPLKKALFGHTSDSQTQGFFMHPAIAVNAQTLELLGLGAVDVWTRTEAPGKAKDRGKKPTQQKESRRWIEVPNRAKERLTQASQITVIGDQESDLFDLFWQVPDARTEVLIRAHHNRETAEGSRIYDYLAQLEVKDRLTVEVPAIAGVRTERRAQLEVRYGSLELRCPDSSQYQQAPASIAVSVIDVREQPASVPPGEDPIQWLLITTHRVNTNAQARQMIHFYCARWSVEQVFRTLKKQGFDLEQSQIQTPESMKKFSVILLGGAIKVMQLTHARDGKSEQSAEVAFDDNEVDLLTQLNDQLTGTTEKQRNPFLAGSLAWASWVIARLGGWKGYPSERPAGPITMYRGLAVFEAQLQGWLLAKKVCIP